MGQFQTLYQRDTMRIRERASAPAPFRPSLKPIVAIGFLRRVEFGAIYIIQEFIHPGSADLKDQILTGGHP